MSSTPISTLETTLVVPDDQQLRDFGTLSYLASYCPLHQQYSPGLLRSLFMPAVTHGCVRFFENEDGVNAAALIWARLSDDASSKMIYDSVPPIHEDWSSGENLWFLDLIAPFGHGKQVIRHLARNPPDGPFYFARLGENGKIRKVTHGDARMGRRGFVQSYRISSNAA